MRETTRHISPLQYAILESTAFIGIGIFEFPRMLVLQAGNDAWWGLIADGAAACLEIWLLLKVAMVDPEETLLGMARRIWPGPGYWAFGLIDNLVHLILPVIALTQFTYVIVTFFLPDTTPWTIELVMTAMAAYIAWWDLPALVRTIQVVYIPVMAVSIGMLILLIPHITNTYAIWPSANLRLYPTMLGALHTFYIFVGFESIPLFWPYVRRQDQPRARHYTYWVLALSCVFYAGILAATLGSENPWYLVHLEWPGISALRLISVVGLLLDKLGLLVVVFWGILSLFFISIRFWSLTHALLPMVRQRTITWYRGIMLGFALTVFAIALLVPNVQVADSWIARSVPFVLLFIFVYPVAFLGTAAWRKRHPVRDIPLSGSVHRIDGQSSPGRH